LLNGLDAGGSAQRVPRLRWSLDGEQRAVPARRIREVDCNGAGIRRRRAGLGFTYWDGDARVTDADALERIRLLAIPPAWEDVWICSDPLGHIQATGLDARGRRQYRYHDVWHEERAKEKFDRVVRFAKRLPDLRETVARDLRREGMPRERVLACAVRLLEVGCFRVGGEAYAEENGSYGLATLRKDHVRIKGDVLWFDYEAKSGQLLQRAVVDRDVREVVTALRRRRSPAKAELLAYKDDEGRWVDVRSQDINDYLKEHLGGEFSAKDFRTWVGTVLTAVALADEERPTSETGRKRVVKRTAEAVAGHLGNTPAVARSAYIDPRVIERFDDGDTIAGALDTDDIEDIERAVRLLVQRAERNGRGRRKAPAKAS
jgi:DNA topoisomerase I